MNVLFIVTDQLRYDCVGASGIRPVKTPNMDRLAAEGLFFENAYSPLPVCAPSRQAMLTGVQPDSIGALFNYNFVNTRGANPAVPTWVSELKDRGYRCGFAGHWDASPDGNETAFGYETVFDGGAWADEISKKYGRIDYPNSWFGCPNPIAFEDTKTYRICKSSAEFIRTSAGQPWHIWVDITDPHLPCRPSAIQKKQLENWHLEGRTWEEFAPTVAFYYGMISQTDAAIGQLLDALDETGQTDDTLVILLSDHGDTCGDHGMMDKHYILYDSVVHVPFIVKAPGLEPARVKSFACSSLDVAPTVEKLVGLTAESERHGRPATDYADGTASPDFAVFSSNGQQFGLFTQRGIRTERYKYIWNATDRDEFYDLSLDPGEKVNRASDPAYREVMKELGGRLFAELRRRKDPFANGWVDWQFGEGI